MAASPSQAPPAYKDDVNMVTIEDEDITGNVVVTQEVVKQGDPNEVAPPNDGIARIAQPKSKTEKILAILSLSTGLLLYALDATMVSVAVPRIVADLGGADLLSWIGTAYLLTSTAIAPLWGRIGDIFGRKLMLILNTIVFILASIICALAPNMITLIVGRGLQGVGAGGIQALVYVIISDIVTLRERGTYQAVLGAIVGVGAIVGPFVGGVITDNWSWRGTFWISLPVGGLALVGYMFFLHSAPLPPAEAGKSRWDVTKGKLARVDYGGAALCIIGVTCFLLGLTWGASIGWSTAQTLAPLIIGIFLTACFVFYEAKVPKEPAVPPRLFKIRNMSLAYMTNFFAGWYMQAGGYFMPLFFQLVQGNSPTTSGLKTMPSIAVTIPVSIICGIVSSKTGKYVFFPKIGMAVSAVAMGLISTWQRTTPLEQQIGYMCLMGLGTGMVASIIMLIIQANLPIIDLGPGTTVASFVRSVGGVFGIGIAGTVLQSVVTSQITQSSVIALATQLGVSPITVGNLIKQISSGYTPTPSPGVTQETIDSVTVFTQDAYAVGLEKVFLSIAVATAVGFLFSVFMTHVQLRTTMGEAPAAKDDKDTKGADDKDLEKNGSAVALETAAATENGEGATELPQLAKTAEIAPENVVEVEDDLGSSPPVAAAAPAPNQ